MTKGRNRGGIAPRQKGGVTMGGTPSAIQGSRNRRDIEECKNPGAVKSGGGSGRVRAWEDLKSGGACVCAPGAVEEKDSCRGRDRGKNGSGSGWSRSRKGTRSLPCGTFLRREGREGRDMLEMMQWWRWRCLGKDIVIVFLLFLRDEGYGEEVCRRRGGKGFRCYISTFLVAKRVIVSL